MQLPPTAPWNMGADLPPRPVVYDIPPVIEYRSPLRDLVSWIRRRAR